MCVLQHATGAWEPPELRQGTKPTVKKKEAACVLIRTESKASGVDARFGENGEICVQDVFFCYLFHSKSNRIQFDLTVTISDVVAHLER